MLDRVKYYTSYNLNIILFIMVEIIHVAIIILNIITFLRSIDQEAEEWLAELKKNVGRYFENLKTTEKRNLDVL